MNARLLLTLLLAALPAPLHAARPNIVMVLVDDMGWGDFSCFGNKAVETPNIDRMAKEGIRFSQFYVASPICSPSRCGLTTGQYPQRWRITSFLENRNSNNRRGMAQWLDPNAPTLARQLQQNGYATGHFGKWHLGGQRDVDDAPAITTYGFDRSLTNFEGMGPKLLPLAIAPSDEKPHRIWAEATRLGGPVTWMKRSEITTGFIDAALGFIDEAARANKPFYINLWPDDVHSPFWPPVDKWADGKRGLYQSVLREMDRQFGKLFDRIRETPALRDNTLVLICSDNGPEPGAGSAGPFSGAKGTLHEGGIRSPLIAWGPGLIEKSAACSHNETTVFATIDLTPSLLALTGAPAPSGVRFDGEDFSKALIGKPSPSRKAPLHWRRPPDRPGDAANPLPDLAIRDGDWKLVCTYDGGSRRLYDLAKDPAEAADLAANHPDVARKLTEAVLAWHRSMPPDGGTGPVPARKGVEKE